MRRVILSEQGFHTPEGPDGETVQAAAYRYAWKKVSALPNRCSSSIAMWTIREGGLTSVSGDGSRKRCDAGRAEAHLRRILKADTMAMRRSSSPPPSSASPTGRKFANGAAVPDADGGRSPTRVSRPSERLPDDFAGNLRGALEAVGEDDGHLADLHAPAPDPVVGEFDLKAVSVGADGFGEMASKVFLRKHLKPPVGSVTGMPVIHWTYFAAVMLSRRRLSGQLITRIPVAIPGSQHEVGILLPGGFQEAGDVGGLWEKSASISKMNSYLRASAHSKPAR